MIRTHLANTLDRIGFALKAAGERCNRWADRVEPVPETRECPQPQRMALVTLDNLYLTDETAWSPWPQPTEGPESEGVESVLDYAEPERGER